MTTATSFNTKEIKEKFIIAGVDRPPESSQSDPFPFYLAGSVVNCDSCKKSIVMVIGIISKQLEYAFL